MMRAPSRIKRRKGEGFSIARATAHAIMREGEGAFLPFCLFATSRALRMESQRASICKFAGMTRLSLRVMVGESAGSRVVGSVDVDRVRAGSVLRSESAAEAAAATTPSGEAFAAV